MSEESKDPNTRRLWTHRGTVAQVFPQTMTALRTSLVFDGSRRSTASCEPGAVVSPAALLHTSVAGNQPAVTFDEHPRTPSVGEGRSRTPSVSKGWPRTPAVDEGWLKAACSRRGSVKDACSR